MKGILQIYFLILIFTQQKSEGYKKNDYAIIGVTNDRPNNGRNMFLNPKITEMIVLSLQLAQKYCQDSFKWDPWNCPTEDFLSKRISKSLDRESAFVSAIKTASLIYTITKNCSNGNIPECDCIQNNEVNKLGICTENLKFAENIADNFFNTEIGSTDTYSHSMLHNNRAAKLIVENSIQKKCKCKNILEKQCDNQICWTLLGSFDEIVVKLRQMYNKALLVKANNRGVLNWNKIPKNVLTFVNKSLNYCQPNVIPNWKGMAGRQCSRTKDMTATLQERRSCRNLCRNCGLKVYRRTVISERNCNCKFTWCCKVTCEICDVTETEYYCG